jgi:hypothetical protein
MSCGVAGPVEEDVDEATKAGAESEGILEPVFGIGCK